MFPAYISEEAQSPILSPSAFPSFHSQDDSSEKNEKTDSKTVPLTKNKPNWQEDEGPSLDSPKKNPKNIEEMCRIYGPLSDTFTFNKTLKNFQTMGSFLIFLETGERKMKREKIVCRKNSLHPEFNFNVVWILQNLYFNGLGTSEPC